MMEDVLIVDGYNIIGAWPELNRMKEISLEEARDVLIEILANYRGISGMRIILVFDAYKVPGHGAKFKHYKIEIIYTKEKETADECIERLCRELRNRRRTIYVATSDYTEQHVAFGQGALRVSARELLIDIESAKEEMSKRLRGPDQMKRNSFDSMISEDMQKILEKWRRGKS